VYASEHPAVRCLSLDFKQAVYAGHLNVDDLDPYVMLYRRLEGYLLQRGETERLELVRRCLYIKADVQLSKRHGSYGWKRSLMEKLAREWHWGPRQLQQMDERQRWRVREVSRERQQLVNELTHSYRFLSRFGRSQGVINQVNSRDLSLLGRRLYAAFERKAGKVEVVNPGIVPDLSEPLLTLARKATGEAGQAGWTLYRGTLTQTELGDHAPLKRAPELMELLAWAHRNGLIDGATRFALHPGDSALSEYELHNHISALQQQFPLPLPALTEAALSRASEPCQVLLLINVGLDPLPAASQKNLHLISSHTDALGYSGLRDNLVLSIDQITLNSWNELLVTRYAGEESCIQALCDFLANGCEHRRLPELQVRCYCPNRSNAIAERVEQLFHDAARHLLAEPAPRFLLQLQNSYRLLVRRDKAIEVISLADLDRLVRYLGSSSATFQPLVLDNYALQGQDLALILGRSKADCVQIFYRILSGQQAEVSLLDERGALWQQRQPYRDERTLLAPLLRFLQSISLRKQAAMSLEHSMDQRPLSLQQIMPAIDGQPQRLQPQPLPLDDMQTDYFPVQAIAEPAPESSLSVTIYCGEREFSQWDHGDQLFSEVARHIFERRQSREPYPCYITDLDLSAIDPAGTMQTVQYLRYRQRLEDALNRALAAFAH
jgi:adenylate cyclase, class 1